MQERVMLCRMADSRLCFHSARCALCADSLGSQVLWSPAWRIADRTNATDCAAMKLSVSAPMPTFLTTISCIEIVAINCVATNIARNEALFTQCLPAIVASYSMRQQYVRRHQRQAWPIPCAAPLDLRQRPPVDLSLPRRNLWS